MNFLHGSALSAAIRNTLNGRRADIAVAFWGDGACKLLAIPFNAKGSRVACDARSGAGNPSAISDLMKRNVAIVDVRGLHAKVYIGEKGVIISSANASANGLGEEGEEILAGLEAGYLTQRREDIELARQWFEDLYTDGKPVTEDDLPELRKLWTQRQLHRPTRRPDTQRSWRDWLNVVNCARLPEEILDDGVYICPTTGAAFQFKPCRFFGMYHHKAVELVAEIQAIVDIDAKAKTQTLQWKNPDYPKTDTAFKSLALKKRNDLRPRETPVRVFLLGEQFRTSFRAYPVVSHTH
jgi:hypothetical protein